MLSSRQRESDDIFNCILKTFQVAALSESYTTDERSPEAEQLVKKLTDQPGDNVPSEPDIRVPSAHIPSIIPHEAAPYTADYSQYPLSMGWVFPPLIDKDRMHPTVSDDNKTFGP